MVVWVMVKRWKHKRFGNTKREYGDYLYYQDRIMFDMNYEDYCKEKGKITKKKFREILNNKEVKK